MQKFFTTTLVSKFIKYLLMNTPLPTCSFLNDSDIMVESNLYVYKGHVYKCTKTGVFKGSQRDLFGFLCCSDLITCGNELVVSDDIHPISDKFLAEYDILYPITEGENIYGLTEEFISTRGWYDADTHRKLGDYLRFLRSQYGLNLMSLYNCFSNIFVNDIDLTSGKLQESVNKRYKVTLVPIKFNRTYTVALDTFVPIYMKPVIYDGKLLRDSDNKFLYNSSMEVKKVSHAKFSDPMTINITNYDKELQKMENDLYLAIQIPVNISSPIVVLEGQYSRYTSNNIWDEKMYNSSIEPYIDSVMTGGCSLLITPPSVISKNNPFAMTSSIPFSDRLIEYLVRHTIDSRESLTENIDKVVSALDLSRRYSSEWSNEIRGLLFKRYMALRDKRDELVYDDILGYVDKDIEDAIDKGYMRHGNK